MLVACQQFLFLGDQFRWIENRVHRLNQGDDDGIAKEIVGADIVQQAIHLLGHTDYITDADILRGAARFIRRAQSEYKVSPIIVVSPANDVYKTYAVCADVKLRLRKMRLQTGRYCRLNDPLEETPAVSSGISEATVLQLISRRDKVGFLRYASTIISQGTKSPDSDAYMAHLHHRLLDISFACLRNHGISVDAVFNTDALRGMDAQAESSGYEMLHFAQMLFERICLLLSDASMQGDSVEMAKQYIRAHYTENIDRDAVAAAACVAPNYLSKIFRSKTDMNLREYINTLRIRKAEELMFTTSRPITEIVMDVGFDNISYFSTVFRKAVEVSPAEWRASYAGGKPEEALEGDQ